MTASRYKNGINRGGNRGINYDWRLTSGQDIMNGVLNAANKTDRIKEKDCASDVTSHPDPRRDNEAQIEAPHPPPSRAVPPLWLVVVEQVQTPPQMSDLYVELLGCEGGRIAGVGGDHHEQGCLMRYASGGGSGSQDDYHPPQQFRRLQVGSRLGGRHETAISEQQHPKHMCWTHHCKDRCFLKRQRSK